MKSTLKVFAIAGGALLASCSKTEIPLPNSAATETTAVMPGLPVYRMALSGYMYACYTSFGTSSHMVINYASFAEPDENLMRNFNHYTDATAQNIPSDDPSKGNISVGKVQFAGVSMFSSPQASNTRWNYNGNFNANKMPAATWFTEGNGPFKPVNTAIPRGFPSVNDSIVKKGRNDTLTSKGYTVNTSGFVANYDSIAVQISAFGSGQVIVTKSFAAGSAVAFSEKDVEPIKNVNPGFGVQVSFWAYNYSNYILEDKKYVFELATKVNQKSVAYKQ